MSATTAHLDFANLAQRYIDAWNESDANVRRAAVDALFSEDATYVDPVASAEGREALTALIGAVQEQFGGFTFRLAGTVDGHHNQLRFGWELGPAGSPAPVVGFDVAVVDEAGRIRAVLGFLDKVPVAA
jgi:SnoaL-like domain